MKPIRPALALCAATAALCGSFAYGEALPAKSQERLPMASLSASLAALPRPAPAAPEAADETGGQYRIAVSRVTPPASLLAETASTVVPAHFAPPPQEAGPDDRAGGAPPPPPEARRGPPPPHGPREARDMPPPPPPPPGPLEIAGQLAAQEIALAIRADQLDVWRAYAGAVVDMVDLDPVTPPKTPEPFSLPEALATRAVSEGKKAQALLEARSALVARLSPAQLDKARKLSSAWPQPPEPPQPPPPPRPAPGERP